MSQNTVYLDQLIGGVSAAVFLNNRAAALVDNDLMDPRRALEFVCAQASAGVPVVLADPGQTWHCRDDQADWLHIIERLPGARFRAADRLGCVHDLPIEFLNGYELRVWRWAP
jgi:hypothetical protein